MISKRAWREILTVFAAVVSVAASACGSSASNGASSNPDSGYSGGGSADSGVLTDDQIVGIVSTANSGEVAIAQLALSRSQNSAVTNVAQMMVTMHG